MNTLQQQIRKNQLELNKITTQVQEYEKDKYNAYQNYLYKRALYGLSSLPQDEVATMCSKKKQRIINVYKRAQDILNVAKQQATIYYTNNFFKAFFPESSLTQEILECTETDVKFKNTLNFKDLNIDKDQIIAIFIEEGVLPKNFLSLTRDPNQLPRLK